MRMTRLPHAQPTRRGRFACRLERAARALLRDDRGDSLVESLIAVLIAALGAAALATMVMVSTSVVEQTGQSQAAGYDAASQVYALEGAKEQGPTVTIEAVGASEDATVSEHVAVTVFSSKDGTYARYVEGKG